MTYNPFTRGEYPVGVRTIELIDDAAGENITAEVWYPATENYRGKDLDESAKDSFKIIDEFPIMTQDAVRDADHLNRKNPLVMYWHGGYGHRREATEICTYLASHGFTVASPDFPGDNAKDMYSKDAAIKDKPIDDSAKARPRQARSVLDRITSGKYEFLNEIVDGEQIGTFGVSMGGFTSLALNSIDGRQKASIPFAPMSSAHSPAPQIRRLSSLLKVDNWKTDVSTFMVSGTADALVLIDDIRELFTRLPEPKRLAVLEGAGHIHWSDKAEMLHEIIRSNYSSPTFADPELDGPAMAAAFRPFAELCPAQHSIDTMRAICLAHFDRHLRGNEDAAGFLDKDLGGVLTARGIDIEVT